MSEHRITVGYPGRSEHLDVTVPDTEPAPWDLGSSLRIVGRPTPRLDAVDKVTGAARFTQDLRLPGMLTARILRAPIAAGLITAIDPMRAIAHAGVRAVWADQVGRRIRFAGQEVAAVAADAPAIAEEALHLIRVEYLPGAFVVDAEAARQPGAPLVLAPGEREEGSATDEPVAGRVTVEGNVRTVVTSEPHGVDIDRAFAEADVVVEGTYRTRAQTHAALETHAAIAAWDGDRLTVYTSTQATSAVRSELARALRIDGDRVRVVCQHMGGGFGGKRTAGAHALLAARLAREAQAPVKLVLSRREEQEVTGHRPDSVQWLKLGARRDGTLVALHLRSRGATGVGAGAGTGGPARAIYQIKSVRTEESDVATHGSAAQPMRAPGQPQGCFALEQSLDELAAKLGMDPVDLRKRNLKNPVQIEELDRVARGPIPVITEQGVVRRAAAWLQRGPSGSSQGPIKRGIGLACGVGYKVVSRGAQVGIDIHRDGRVVVRSGAQDLGTGTRTLLAMVAAEELALPLSAIEVRLGDTDDPRGPASAHSTTATSLAPAVRAAAHQARRRILAVAAEVLHADPSRLLLQEGLISVAGDLGGGLSFAAAAARMPGDRIAVVGTRSEDFEGRWGRIGGVQVAEVEVDTRTGVVRVVRVTAVHDCGRVLNPLTAVSQVHGGVVQGVSLALLEERVIDAGSGRVLNADLETYKIVGPRDCPDIEVALFETSPGFNTTGALGLGEAPTVPTAAAIANAIENALGVRIRELPLTPARVLAALDQAAAEAGAPAGPIPPPPPLVPSP